MDTVEQRLCTLATTQSLEPKEVSGGPCQEVDRRDSSFPYPAESQSGPGMGWDTSRGAGPAKGKNGGNGRGADSPNTEGRPGSLKLLAPRMQGGTAACHFQTSFCLLGPPETALGQGSSGCGRDPDQAQWRGDRQGGLGGLPGRVGRAVALVVTLWPLCGGFLAWRPFVQPVAHLKTCLDAAHTVGIQ